MERLGQGCGAQARIVEIGLDMIAGLPPDNAAKRAAGGGGGHARASCGQAGGGEVRGRLGMSKHIPDAHGGSMARQGEQMPPEQGAGRRIPAEITAVQPLGILDQRRQTRTWQDQADPAPRPHRDIERRRQIGDRDIETAQSICHFGRNERRPARLRHIQNIMIQIIRLDLYR